MPVQRKKKKPERHSIAFYDVLESNLPNVPPIVDGLACARSIMVPVTLSVMLVLIRLLIRRLRS